MDDDDSADAARRAREAHEGASGNDEARLAVGRYRHRLARGVVLCATLPAVPAIALGLYEADLGVLDARLGRLLVWMVVWFGGMGLWSADAVWRASPRVMRDERRWLESLPFEVEGYFEWLARSRGRARLRLSIRGPHWVAQRELVHARLAAAYPRFALVDVREGSARFELADIDAESSDRRARVIHEVVDRVLVPLHAEAAIESVEIDD